MGTQDPSGAPPRTGWQKLVSELLVQDIDRSLEFWCGILGFAIAYQRKEDRFAYLERKEGAQIMLCQRTGRWETGALEPPFGRGVMFQIYVDDLEPIRAAAISANHPVHTPLREVWRRTGDREIGQREVFYLDPDGYLLMIAQEIGERPSASPDPPAMLCPNGITPRE
jgi:catechol 2,3-dioxygenase-like lactoylglutathione lyase family enzyme